MSRWFPFCLYVAQLGLRTAMCISKQSTISWSHRLPFFLCFPYFILSPSSFNFQIVTFHCLKILQSLWVLTTSLHFMSSFFFCKHHPILILTLFHLTSLPHMILVMRFWVHTMLCLPFVLQHWPKPSGNRVSLTAMCQGGEPGMENKDNKEKLGLAGFP